MVKRAVPGFLPSTSGLHFNNSFARVPLRSIGIPEVVAVPIGGRLRRVMRRLAMESARRVGAGNSIRP